FLERSNASIRCVPCNKVFYLGKFNQIAAHVRDKHLNKNQVRRSPLENVTNIDKSFVQREVARQSDTFVESESKLMCNFCKMKFCPHDSKNLYHCARRHLRSSRHEKNVTMKTQSSLASGQLQLDGF